MLRPRITAQDLYNYTKCSHRVYLDAQGDPSEKTEVGSFVKLLWELGLQTEREYIDSLGEQNIVDLQRLDIDRAARQTLQEMDRGTEVIYQGCLMSENFVGRPDLLIKRQDGTSRFGSYLYEPVDIKAGRGWDEPEGRKPKFKEHYAFQVLFYRMILEKIQGSVPSEGRIINIHKELESFSPELFESRFHMALQEVKRLVEGEETSEPVLGSHCTMCGWFTRCHRWVHEQSDPSGLFFVGKQKFPLRQVGLHTVQDIARMNVEAYLKPPQKIPRMGEASLRRMKNRARVLISGKPEIRSGFQFPSDKQEIYFDIEDDPTRGVTYLYGLVMYDEGGQSRYLPYLARTPEEEEQAVREFWNLFKVPIMRCIMCIPTRSEPLSGILWTNMD